ncbi:MAG: hypothetical protein HDP34_04255 [Clostridia bacterium]|nr:hypothetical protein [Clostridia bacterium]
MKKVFKALAVAAASLALGAGIGVSAGCSAGYNGVYEGDYHYTNAYGVVYGMKVKVTVENNIITKVEDVTDGAYVTVSEGWVNYYVANWKRYEAGQGDKPGDVTPEYDQYGAVTEASAAQISAIYHNWYKWENSSEANWTDNEAWLLQQYEGMAVADVLDIKVYIKTTGEPYEQKDNNNQARNPYLAENGILIAGSTQGSGRLLLAIQDALSK